MNHSFGFLATNPSLLGTHTHSLLSSFILSIPLSKSDTAYTSEHARKIDGIDSRSIFTTLSRRPLKPFEQSTMNRLRKAYQRGVPDARKAKARMELSDDEESSKPTTKASARPSMSPRDSLSPLDGGLSTKAHPSVGNGRNYGGSSYGQTGISATAPNTKTPSTTNLSNKNDDMKPSRNGMCNPNHV